MGRTVRDVATLFKHMVLHPKSNSFQKDFDRLDAVNQEV